MQNEVKFLLETANIEHKNLDFKPLIAVKDKEKNILVEWNENKQENF
jgi:hypothetical protein